MDPNEFLGLISMATSRDEDLVRLGTIDTLADPPTRATVIFDGESQATAKRYFFATSDNVASGDRVLLLRMSHSWLIMGKVPSLSGSVTYARMSGGSTDIPHHTTPVQAMNGYTDVEGKTAWCNASNGTITIGEDGIYSANAGFRARDTAADSRWLFYIRQNGNVILGSRSEITPSALNSDPALSVNTGPLALVAGDVMDAGVYQNTGATQSVDFQQLSILKHGTVSS